MILVISATPINSGNFSLNSPSKILKGSVSVFKDLPKELYGTWSVSSKIIETNDPFLFNKNSSDIWIFSKNRDKITLTNPSTGATASITVDEVKNNTATFTRKHFTDKFKEYERPQVTVDGDSFYGTDLLVFQHYFRGKYIKTSIVKYEITGKRISGPTINELFSR